uniref:Uncharacterized protein n=1 Tax=Ophidocladus simpliciusculus TaxID=1261574 RepID=A0A1Z1MJJ4_9FLOR|nr:hypothetical protein [Ophidocladus simpliciusculus]ARW65921.1 hypothetical protein [Ophidocladus simpliciusculus]
MDTSQVLVVLVKRIITRFIIRCKVFFEKVFIVH